MEKVQVSTKDAMHLKCIECCCGDWNMIIECRDQMCALFLMRPKRRRDALKAKFWNEETSQFKARPVIKKRTGRVMTEEEKKAAGERLRKIRSKI